MVKTKLDTSLESKPWYTSVTVVSGLLTGVASVVGIFAQVDIDKDLIDQATGVFIGGATLFGGVAAIYGRIRAGKGIHFRKPK